MMRGAYLDEGSNLYKSRAKSIKVNPKLMVNNDRVTMPMNMRRIPMTSNDTKIKYFLFSVNDDSPGSLTDLCSRRIRLCCLRKDAGDTEEYK